MGASGDDRLAAGALTVLLALSAAPATAQEESVGPCSPYRAADGNVPSEMPGCARRPRPAPGTLGDELEFRRARRAGEGAGEEATPDDGDGLARRQKRRHRD